MYKTFHRQPFLPSSSGASKTRRGAARKNPPPPICCFYKTSGNVEVDWHWTKRKNVFLWRGECDRLQSLLNRNEGERHTQQPNHQDKLDNTATMKKKTMTMKTTTAMTTISSSPPTHISLPHMCDSGNLSTSQSSSTNLTRTTV